MYMWLNQVQDLLKFAVFHSCSPILGKPTWVNIDDICQIFYVSDSLVGQHSFLSLKPLTLSVHYISSSLFEGVLETDASVCAIRVRT